MKFKHLLVLFCCWAGSVFGTPFLNPIVNDGADPWVISKDGFYYYTQTTGVSVRLRQTRRLMGAIGIGNSTFTTVFTPPAPYNKNVWAPELHFLQGKWYIYYAADDGVDANHRMFVAEASAPMGPYTFKGKIADSTTDRWAIDGTVLEKDDGTLYFLWSGWFGATHGNQNIYIAPMSNPWTISGPRVNLSTTTYSWEYPNSTFVNEGPEILKRNGKTLIVYSANGTWTDDYCLGLMVNTNGNYLSASSWTKSSTPIFKTYVGADGDVYAPGHCGFARSLDGTEDWIIYHAAQYQGAGFTRNVREQKFAWLANGTPNFGQPIPPGIPVAGPSGEERALENAKLLSDGRLAAVAVPTNGVVQRNFRLNDGTWSGWGSLGGTGFKRISTMRYNDDRLAVLGVGSDSHVWLNTELSSGGEWKGWTNLGGPTFSMVKGAIYSDQRLAAAAVSDGTAVWVNAQQSTNGGWGGWSSLGGSGFWNIDLVKRLDERLVVFGVGTTSVWINPQVTVNGSWGGWANLGGTNFNFVRSILRTGGRLSVFAVGSGTAAWMNSESSPEGTWTGWTNLGGGSFTRVEPISMTDGRMALFATGDYGTVQVNMQTTVGVNAAWGGWTTLSGGGYGSVATAQLADGQLAAVAHNFGTAEFFNSQSGPSRVWGSWSALVGGVTTPQITYSKMGSSVNLRWPTNASGFLLEQSTKLIPALWSAVTNIPTVIGTNNSVTLTNDPASKVFRLRHP
jgi:GH43 family beta-xylosidase